MYLPIVLDQSRWSQDILPPMVPSILHSVDSNSAAKVKLAIVNVRLHGDFAWRLFI
jgi:hypothetical protein